MYRFTLTNNKADHVPIVACFSLFAFFSAAFLTTPLGQIASVIVTGITGYITWLYFKRLHPLRGTIILDLPHCHFINFEQEIKGKISAKSRAYQHCVWLYIEGFADSHWIVINASGVDEQSFIRLKRAIIASS